MKLVSSNCNLFWKIYIEENYILTLIHLLQYSLSNDPNKPCLILTFNEVTMMLDCGLSMQSALSFLPLAYVPSARLINLANWMPQDGTEPDLEGVCITTSHAYFVDKL